ncbi:MAG: N-acetylmuramoyl-L-alanine amidase [[Clostridium] symbiosum]|nr:N-acetylmuramoyl-L-alanine amidase [[Clostridium] symbiosum]
MIKAAGCRGAAILLSLFLTAAAVTGCGGKYEQVPLPAREETQVSEAEDVQAPGESVEGAQEGEAGESRMLVLEDAQDVQAAQEADGVAVAEMSSLESGLTTANGFTEVDETVYILEDKVNLRKGCGTQFGIVTQLNTGDSIKRTGYSEGWSRVVYKDKECYVMSEFLSKEDPTGAGGENVMALENQPVQAGADGSAAAGGRIVAIDAGHQAKGNSEKEPIGPQKLRRILEERGYKVIMIRESNDVNLSNAERAEIANKSGASIFVRVHANSLDNNSVHGTLSMCQTAKNRYNGNLHAKSYSLSKKITDYVCAATGFKNRGVQETDSMSGINWCTIPVTIIEMGFMSNPEEDQKMAQDDYQELIAAGIANGIDAYFNE